MIKRIFVIGSLFVASSSFAQSGLSETARKMAEKIISVEKQLYRDDAREISYHLDRINQIVSRYRPDRGGSFVCVSNGEFGGLERFYIVDARTGENLGGETSYENCKRSIR